MIFDKKYRDIRRTRKIFKALELPREGKIIDISCGGGRLLKTIENHNGNLELTGVDITPGFLANNPDLSNITFITADSSSIPFPDQSFEVVICSLSLHHYEDLPAVLTEINRIVNNHGQVYLTDIMPSNQISQKLYNLIKCNEPYHFEKFYTEAEIKKLVEPLGFSISKRSNISIIPRVLTIQLTKNEKV